MEVQAGSGFVQDIQGLARISLRQFPRQFDPLGLTTRQGGSTLAKADITQANIHQGLQAALDHGYRIEKSVGVLDGEAQYLVNTLALVHDLKGFAIVTLAFTLVAGDINVGEKMHLHLDQPVTLAGFTASAFDIKAKTSRFIASRARL